jgi:asparagine synthase (glutamine-hydrolysing)
MCGINGFNWQDKRLIKGMNNSLKHRGPDGEGTYFGKKVSLGHRRLAVIDLSEKGKQPMSYFNKGKKVIIVYNGEVYNFLEIKKELEEKGYKFKSKTDTEVILASYFEWGFDCVNKFNGMWAFCIFDLRKNILFLSRDRFGKKPLYYFYDKKKFIFSSELKGILKHKINKKINRESVDLYLSLGFIPAPYSIYKDISKLEASQNLIYNLKSGKIKKYFYYSLPEYNPIYDKKQLIEEGRTLLKDSVRLRLISDVPLGAFLSGGLDSSAVVTQMSDYVDLTKLNTFSMGFEGKFDESKYSKLMKNTLGTIHHHKYFKEENFKEFLDGGKIFYYYDEPFSEHSMFPTSSLSKLVRKYVTVSLSGDGGDEVFGGYPRYKINEQLEILRKIPKDIRKILIKLTKGKIKEGIRLSLKNKEEFYSEARPEIYKPKITKKILKEKMKYCLKLSDGDLTEAVRLMDIFIYTLPDRFLLNVDRASMSHSLEVRCPFLDYRFLEYSSKIPSKWKCNIFNTRIIMREILKGTIPDEIIKRKKAGFTPPLINWINKPEYTNDMKLALEELYNKKIIDKEWYEFYKDTIKKQDKISKGFKIRLFLLWKWYLYWNNNQVTLS